MTNRMILAVLMMTLGCGTSHVTRKIVGANCFDATGDTNGDKELTVDDCVGIAGADGADGVDGVDGKDGADGIAGTDGTDGADAPAAENILIYEGYYCSRTVYRLGTDGPMFVLHGQLIKLTTSWLPISASCKLRLSGDHVQVGS